MGARISCADCCCPRSRNEKQFGAGRDRLDDMSIWVILTNNQISIDVLLSLQITLLLLWIAMCYLHGFALYEVDTTILQPTGWGHSVSNLGWWLMIEVFLSWFLRGNTKFNLAPPNGKMQLSAADARTCLLFGMCFAALTFISNLGHVITLAFELHDAESTFTIHNQAFLIIFLIGMALYATVFKVALVLSMRVYYKHLGFLCKGAAVRLLDMDGKRTSPEMDNSNDEDTPLLKEMRNKGR